MADQQAPMDCDADTFRSASRLIERYGRDAPIMATIRMAEQIGFVDKRGQADWLRIAKAIDDWLSEDRPSDARLN